MTHLPPRVAFTTATTGTGAVTVGTALAQMLTPDQAGAVDAASYLWLIQEGDDWQLVQGVYTASGPSFSRDTTLKSLIDGTPGTSNLNLAGNGVVRMVLSAETFADLTVEGQELTGGVEVTSKSLGTQSSGTLTLDMGDRPLQHYTNDGAHTLAPGTVTGSALIDITNGSSAGAITTSGWTKVEGDAFTTTDGDKFRCHASVGNGGSLLIVEALQ